MNPHRERIPHLGRSNPPEERMDPPPKKVAHKKMVTQMKQRDNITKQRYAQIGDRVVKITFTSDKKKRKEYKKRKQINMIISQKKKNEFEKKKKMLRKMNNMIQTEREKGNVYFLPKKFRQKKKTKRKRLILLEKEAKQSVYNDLLGVIQNGDSKSEPKRILPQMGGAASYGREGYIKFIARKAKWRAMGSTNSSNCRWGQLKEEGGTRRDSSDGDHHLEEAPTGATGGASQIGEEVACVKRFLLLWGGKFPRGGGLRSGSAESSRKGAVRAPPLDVHSKTDKLNDPPQRAHSKTDMLNDPPQCAHSKTDKLNDPTQPERHGGDLPSREQIKECILRSEKIMNYIQTTRVQKKTYINEYVDQVITEELNSMVKSLLEKISKSQEKLFLMKKKKKRYYLGLRESYRHVCIDDPKLVLLAPNIEPMTNGVFDDQVNKIISKCREKGIPLVYALSKNLLGKCIKKSRQSVICIVDNDSFIGECDAIVRLANSLRRHAPVSSRDTSVGPTLNAP
ncbi:ribosomal protein [Plasmodium cynomolgi strain B]|uniref:Ribosomal protein n=1 Tax=Plasmodium cynomolgi (strain B) TaxID=1120755 RepID=K6VAL9_PLACD|nr:ribosomal protein [Plasmodium cynomolgi strain B]GAB66237.1 ribosomal protein [Plasmodium cynomolgi strain B]